MVPQGPAAAPVQLERHGPAAARLDAAIIPRPARCRGIAARPRAVGGGTPVAIPSCTACGTDTVELANGAPATVAPVLASLYA
ncbi:MAG: hypothetical protein EKK55_01875 [Rhodocyclaceae bacterium]|nr:MAG: hypothetical protein EKK55_01875 [Rhodocyclaceae bacterium]